MTRRCPERWRPGRPRPRSRDGHLTVAVRLPGVRSAVRATTSERQIETSSGAGIARRTSPPGRRVRVLLRAVMLIDDALRDLEDGLLVVGGGGPEEAFGLFGVARFVDHEESGRDRDL